MRIIAATAVAAAMAGCAQTKSWMDNIGKSDSSSSYSSSEVLGAPEADVYLQDLADIASGDPARQAEIYEDARARAQLTPNPSTRLRYALVLAAPGHPGSNPQEAQSMLRDIMTQAPLMTQSEIALAQISLASVEQRMVLESENRRLRAASDQARRTQQQAVSQRLATVEAENRRLQEELTDAEQKLEAITSIERSIRNQE